MHSVGLLEVLSWKDVGVESGFPRAVYRACGSDAVAPGKDGAGLEDALHLHTTCRRPHVASAAAITLVSNQHLAQRPTAAASSILEAVEEAPQSVPGLGEFAGGTRPCRLMRSATLFPRPQHLTVMKQTRSRLPWKDVDNLECCRHRDLHGKKSDISSRSADGIFARPVCTSARKLTGTIRETRDKAQEKNIGLFDSRCQSDEPATAICNRDPKR